MKKLKKFFLKILPLLFTCSAAGEKRPNILLILADNWAYPHASICGDEVVSTPNFDRVAKEGALFTNTYCQVPSCSPARAVLLTGQACHRLHDAANLWGNWPHSLKTYPELLEDASYRVGQEMKGWAPGVIFQKSNARRNRNPAGPKFQSFSAFLDRTPGDEPFCYWIGSHNPHQPWTAAPKFRAGLDASKVRVPAYLPDVPEIRETILDYYAEVQEFDHEVGLALAELEKRDLVNDTIVIVMGDNGWQTPRGLANVYDAGTRTPLAIRWPGKIKPGERFEQFISFEDFAPSFLKVAGLELGSKMTGTALPILTGEKFSSMWRDAIFLERERHANVRDGDRSYPCRAIRTKEFLYVWNLEPDLWPAGDPEMHFAVGPYGDVDNTNFKSYILANCEDPKVKPFFDLGFGMRPVEELYHLATDPDQVKNVASNPEYEKVRKELRNRVEEWMAKTGDPRAKNSSDPIFGKYKYFGGPPRRRK